MDSPQKIIELKNISKYFGAVRALEKVNFELYEGEILALLGDNGAGKSTLIKIISGVYPQDEGEIWVFGQKTLLKNPLDAMRIGIVTIYQDLALFDNLDVPANLFAGREMIDKGAINKVMGFAARKKMTQESRACLERISVEISDYRQPVKFMSGGQRQSIAIAKAIYWGQRIVIMDEPTAALGVRESGKVIQLIRDLKQHGVSVILIMHNIDQVIEIAERAIVLRQGIRVGEVDIRTEGAASRDKIIQMML